MKIYRLLACIVGAVLILIGTYVFADTQKNNNIPSILPLLLSHDKGGEKPPLLKWVSISGPTEIYEGEGGQYTCRAYYIDSSNHVVTSNSQWSDNSNYAGINTSGYLTTTSVLFDQIVTITANYGEMSDTHSVTIVNIDPLNPPDPPDPENKCEALSGELEVQILVGPAGVVGLEPMAVGSIPFYTICDGDSCTVQGNGDFSYQEVLSEDWGTYNVTLDMDVEIIGECVSSATNDSLNLTVTASGNQMVEVDADDFHGEYPWEGTHEFDVVFPLEEGAKAGGEGWEVMLHIN